jgi:hypothetical protein
LRGEIGLTLVLPLFQIVSVVVKYPHMSPEEANVLLEKCKWNETVAVTNLADPSKGILSHIRRFIAVSKCVIAIGHRTPAQDQEVPQDIPEPPEILPEDLLPPVPSLTDSFMTNPSAAATGFCPSSSSTTTTGTNGNPATPRPKTDAKSVNLRDLIGANMMKPGDELVSLDQIGILQNDGSIVWNGTRYKNLSINKIKREKNNQKY